MKKLFLLTLLPALILSCTAEPKAQPKLDTDRLITDLETLASDEMEGRLTGTEGNRKAREFIIQRFEEEGAKAFQGSFTHEFIFPSGEEETSTGINVVGVIEGKSDSVIVVSAHYDHLGVREGEIFNGTDDNASGTSALIAMIDYFAKAQPNHTLVFAAFDKEEGGLRGARAFVEDSVFLEKVVLNVNMDMISQNTVNELYAVGTSHYPHFKPVLESIETGEISLLFGHDTPDLGYNDWTSASDHGAFHAKGVPFIYFGVEDHEHYHKATDEFATVPLEFYKSSVQVILNAVIALDNR